MRPGAVGQSNLTTRPRATYGSEIVKLASFEVPAATIAITPDAGEAGDQVRLSVAGMPPNTRVVSITIGGAEVLDAQELRTDGEGAVMATVTIPGLRPGTYSVVVKVGASANQTVAIASLSVLSSSITAGAMDMTPDRGFPGDEVGLSVAGTPANAVVSAITIGVFDILRGRELRTDQRGALTTRIIIPGLDYGTYPVIVWVGRGPGQTVAVDYLAVGDLP